MGWLIGAILSLIMWFAAMIITFQTGDKENITAIIFLLVFTIFCFVKYRNIKNGVSEKRKIEKQVREMENNERIELNSKLIQTKHQAGLPLAQDMECTIVNDVDKFTITGGGNSFSLKKDKLTDISVKTDIDIQKSYVSSIGGAVAGGVVFGPLGAIVGGRAKQKESRTTTYYIIFTYLSKDVISYASFELPINYLTSAKKWENAFTGQRTEETIEL